MPQSDSCVAERRAEHRDQLLQDVIDGLSASDRNLPSKHFYDERGSQLFDQICELDEYYPTRTETAIMRDCGTEIADCIGPNARLVEYGSGSSVKTRILLDELTDLADYVPVDISDEHLHQTAEKLSKDYPLLTISPVVADFTQPFELPDCSTEHNRTCIYFPGSTIGNFTWPQAIKLLSAMRTVADHGSEDQLESDQREGEHRGGLLIGVDLQKDLDVLEAAYNDSDGVTAEFNLNLLHRINRELDADFDLEQFRHRALYDTDSNRIEMRLTSLQDQRVSLGDYQFDFVQGEEILTEYSHKYTVEDFAERAANVGWTLRQAWTDEREYFAVMYFED